MAGFTIGHAGLSGNKMSVVLKQATIVFRPMSVLTGEAHILNLCIKSGLQNNGLGKEMVNYLIELAKVHYADVMFLEVRPSNKQALKIYDNFDEIGSRKDYYPAKFGREDALILAKQLTEKM